MRCLPIATVVNCGADARACPGVDMDLGFAWEQRCSPSAIALAHSLLVPCAVARFHCVGPVVAGKKKVSQKRYISFSTTLLFPPSTLTLDTALPIVAMRHMSTGRRRRFAVYVGIPGASSAILTVGLGQVVSYGVSDRPTRARRRHFGSRSETNGLAPSHWTFLRDCGEALSARSLPACLGGQPRHDR